jgi:hypothetical protein
MTARSDPSQHKPHKIVLAARQQKGSTTSVTRGHQTARTSTATSVDRTIQAPRHAESAFGTKCSRLLASSCASGRARPASGPR